ncbi:conserved hypothetical protein [Paecilomyces variotii No. 5]|uniref:Tubby C-terminal-like domain-containing protein n=1 Tax=Byssochlamys spectabilis (strain No. 5 / NBRC 109023) TaxID=1356009 RepID=V5G6R0_BYSSN|nr:conserved hypothetical protein [Paecilomyces variotii No. 5]
MLPELTPPKKPIALRPEHVVDRQTVFRVQQHGKALSAGKFTVFSLDDKAAAVALGHNAGAESAGKAFSSSSAAASSGHKTNQAEQRQTMFTVDGKYMSMTRKVHDASGLPLFVLRRYSTSRKWTVELPRAESKKSSQPIAKLKSRYGSLKDDRNLSFKNAFPAEGAENEQVVLHIEGQDIWKQRTNIRYGNRVVMTAKRTDKMSTYLPGIKIEWDVIVTAGMDVSLASIIVVLLGQTMYESY